MLVAFFVGLAALEIAHGVYRISSVRERQLAGFVERLERRHAELALDLRNRLEAQRDHAAYLARMPSVRELLANQDAASRPRAEADVAAYVTSFRDIDRVALLDAAGIELARCERIGGGVGTLPRALLARAPDVRALELADHAGAVGVAVSRFDTDDRRVEAPPSRRQVLHCVAPVRFLGASSERAGVLVLTAYAAPMLANVREFEPLAGVRSVWIDEGARDVAPPIGGNGERPRVDLTQRAPAALAAIFRGEASVRDGDVVLLAAAIDVEPPTYLVTQVPDAALDAALGSLSGEYAWVSASMLAITAVLSIAAVFFVRLSARAYRLREAELSLRDVERQRQLERQLQTSERLSALGLLTAGVAHEINNPLEGIGNYLALLEKPGIPEEKRTRYVGLVRDGFERIRVIVRDLLSFSRPGVERGDVDLAQVVARAVKLVGYSKPFANVPIDLRGFDGRSVVPGDAGRLEQVLVNLLLNAAAAMHGNGRVTITARRVEQGGEAALELAVDDQGPGIPPDDLSRIFDPFFTTTEGTGLGLAVSYGIVRAHGGTLTASNRASGGASFVVRLPASSAAAPASAART